MINRFLDVTLKLPLLGIELTWPLYAGKGGLLTRGIGFVIGFGNLNGIVSSNIYRHGPRYIEGHGIVLAYLIVLLLGGSILMTTLLRIENKKRIEGKRNLLVEGKLPHEIAALGDRRPDFSYTV